MNYEVYEVGKKIIDPRPDGVMFDLTSGGAVLQICMGAPTEKEKSDFGSGVSQFKVAVADDIIFFLSKFGTGPWMDAPFYFGLSHEYELLAPLLVHEGLTLHAMLIDGATGILVAQRVIGLHRELSMGLLQLASMQPEIPDYSARLSVAMSRYTTKDLVDMAVL